MSEFVKHTSCPECGSKDNRAIYDDGHEYCFGCHDYVKGHNFKKIEQLNTSSLKNTIISLPDDIVFNIPEVGIAWLARYGITPAEASLFKFVWSEERQMLIMPIYNREGKLLAWQGRVFDNIGPKYYTKGKIEDIDYIVEDEDDVMSRLVVVEDMLSAIKVSRITTVMPLFGSNLSKDRLVRLARQFSRLVVWLDRDKAKYAAELYPTAKLMFDHVSIIVKERDPKEYSDYNIEIALRGA